MGGILRLRRTSATQLPCAPLVRWDAKTRPATPLRENGLVRARGRVRARSRSRPWTLDFSGGFRQGPGRVSSHGTPSSHGVAGRVMRWSGQRSVGQRKVAVAWGWGVGRKRKVRARGCGARAAHCTVSARSALRASAEEHERLERNSKSASSPFLAAVALVCPRSPC